MRKCPNCGRDIADDAKYCNYCGTTLKSAERDDNNFTSFGQSPEYSSPNYKREYTMGGAPSGTDLLTVKHPMPFWAFGLVCAVQGWLGGWLFGILLSWLLAMWQGKYYEGMRLYEQGDTNGAYGIWASAKSYKIGYFVALGIVIFIQAFIVILAFMTVSSAFGGFFGELGQALTY